MGSGSDRPERRLSVAVARLLGSNSNLAFTHDCNVTVVSWLQFKTAPSSMERDHEPLAKKNFTRLCITTRKESSSSP